MEMIKIVLLKEASPDNHYQVTYDGDGPYSIGSTIDVSKEMVVQKLELANPHATVEVEQ